MLGLNGCPMFGGGWAVMALLTFLWLLLLAAVVLVAIWLATRRGLTRESPLDILNRRYASGEINREEYERMKREISSSEG